MMPILKCHRLYWIWLCQVTPPSDWLKVSDINDVEQARHLIRCWFTRSLEHGWNSFEPNGYMTWHDFFEASARGKAKRLAHGPGIRSCTDWINLKTPQTTRNCRWGSPTARDEVWITGSGSANWGWPYLGQVVHSSKGEDEGGHRKQVQDSQCDRHWELSFFPASIEFFWGGACCQVKSAIDETPKSNSKLFPEFDSAGFSSDL